ncbi:DUF4149 domain-containing protein [Tepidimonas taiwanensis]|uniref:TMEM205-like domain-containing protein n=1 Tax=Tepidimonas taiwanensis TaxID=307486 RepID=A0A554X9A9_9BURK|nr:DUF4149 domain-containing protein [Tepidimonas taiwanensis]MCX7694070.1 DUF4149 domain-containing protein [Tepidimonas taiwanensis]MDM7463024.1 DUF4149 domain-containing protein [Tepidimonas taiwanensis]TSE32407.1 hypothetical protein Ttaiw_01181 [Tepidimonas taiwanensis]UBQ06584.1 DUF4149 domain-containing protein [Tepidimonas taiwanensis]
MSAGASATSTGAVAAWRARWPLLVAALWWGVTTGLSFIAVPLLFDHFSNPAVAGGMAARLFQVQSYLSVAAALALLLWGRAQRGRGAAGDASWALLPWLLLGALSGLVQEFGVAEKILTARQTGANLALWHGLGSVLVALQWLCALRGLWWLAGRRG